jgi:rhodanese-related sulfurtransferase
MSGGNEGLRVISPREAHEQLKAGKGTLVDVRTPAEYREVHAVGAKLAPLDRFDPAAVLAEFAPGGSTPLLVICRSGARARQACERLKAAGCADLALVEGGTLAWEGAGLPVERGKATISLERQVRLVVGTLTIAGTALGAFANPWFLLIPAFLGAGLLYAGITDTCGLAMILSKLPWNRAGDPRRAR